MSDDTVRPAVEADIATLRQFEQQVVAAERPFDPTLRDSGVRYHDIEAMLQSEQACVLVAESGGEPVGCGFARIDPSKPWLKHAHQAYLGMMYVDPRFRGRGINQRILEALTAWCRARGISELRLEVYIDNERAVRAYRKAGFSGHMLEMRLGLEGEMG